MGYGSEGDRWRQDLEERESRRRDRMREQGGPDAPERCETCEGTRKIIRILRENVTWEWKGEEEHPVAIIVSTNHIEEDDCPDCE